MSKASELMRVMREGVADFARVAPLRATRNMTLRLKVRDHEVLLMLAEASEEAPSTVAARLLAEGLDNALRAFDPDCKGLDDPDVMDAVQEHWAARMAKGEEKEAQLCME